MPPEFRTLPPLGPSWFRMVQPAESTIRLLLDLPPDSRMVQALTVGGLHPGLQIHRPTDMDDALVRAQFDVFISSSPERIAACRANAPRAVRVWSIPTGPTSGEAWRTAHHHLTTDASLTDLTCVLDSAMGGNGVADLRLPKDPNGDVTKLPSAALDVLTLLDDPEASTVQLKRSLMSDPLLVAKVLQMANSPYFGLPRRIGSIDHAVALLGRNNLRSAVLAGACFDAIKGVEKRHIEAVSQRGLKTMKLVREMAGAHAESAVTAAVLVDIGMLLMMKTDPEYPSMVERAAEQGIPLHKMEHDAYGFSHAQLGARLLHEWELPGPTIEAVAFSHTPYPRVRRNHTPRMMLFVATQLIEASERGTPLQLHPDWVRETKLERPLKEWADSLADSDMMAIAS